EGRVDAVHRPDGLRALAPGAVHPFDAVDGELLAVHRDRTGDAPRHVVVALVRLARTRLRRALLLGATRVRTHRRVVDVERLVHPDPVDVDLVAVRSDVVDPVLPRRLGRLDAQTHR